VRIKKSEKFDALCPKVAVLREYLLEVEEQRIHALLWKDILEEKNGMEASSIKPGIYKVFSSCVSCCVLKVFLKKINFFLFFYFKLIFF